MVQPHCLGRIIKVIGAPLYVVVSWLKCYVFEPLSGERKTLGRPFWQGEKGAPLGPSEAGISYY